MKKFTKIFLAFFVVALTSMNTVLPTHAEEESQPTLSQAGFSVSVVGDGTVTVSSGDFTKTLSDGQSYSVDGEEGTEIKIVSKSNENAVIDDITLMTVRFLDLVVVKNLSALHTQQRLLMLLLT